MNDDNLVSHIIASTCIFEAFGNAKTLSHMNSSRYGKVTKLHYIGMDNTDDAPFLLVAHSIRIC